MSNSIDIEKANEHAQSEEGQKLRKQVLTTPTPQLANANEIEYRAFKRPYLKTGNFVLILLANGWYYPTPQVDLYFESVGEGTFRLMQKNSSAFFYLATYHNAQWTSGAGLESIADTITIQDAHGTHIVKVETM